MHKISSVFPTTKWHIGEKLIVLAKSKAISSSRKQIPKPMRFQWDEKDALMIHLSRPCWGYCQQTCGVVPQVYVYACTLSIRWVLGASWPLCCCWLVVLVGTLVACQSSNKFHARSTWANNSFFFFRSLSLQCFHILHIIAVIFWPCSGCKCWNRKKMASTAETLVRTTWCTSC